MEYERTEDNNYKNDDWQLYAKQFSDYAFPFSVLAFMLRTNIVYILYAATRGKMKRKANDNKKTNNNNNEIEKMLLSCCSANFYGGCYRSNNNI